MQLMSTLNTRVPTDVSLIITRGNGIICCKWACRLTLSSTHTLLQFTVITGPGARPPRLVSRTLRAEYENFLTLWWYEYSNALSSLWLKVKGGLLKTFPPTDGPQGPICWQDKQTLNDASQNDLAFKHPRQVVSNDCCSSAMCKHSILDMIYCLHKQGSFS